MKKIFLMIVSFLCFSLFPLFSFAGPRVVGNGGSTIHLSINQQDLIKAVKEAKPSIRFWLYRQEKWLRQHSEDNILRIPPVYGVAKLFPRYIFKNNIYNFFDLTDIVVLMNSPCLDGKGHPWDGLALRYGRDQRRIPPTICLSGGSLLSKLNSYDFRVQIEGLILHELSHLMGTNEAEAVSLQKQYIKEMKSFSPQVVYREAMRVWDQLNLLDRSEFRKNSRKEDYSLLLKLQDSLPASPFFIFSDNDTEQIQNAMMKNRMGQTLVRTLNRHLHQDMEHFDPIISLN